MSGGTVQVRVLHGQRPDASAAPPSEALSALMVWARERVGGGLTGEVALDGDPVPIVIEEASPDGWREAAAGEEPDGWIATWRGELAEGVTDAVVDVDTPSLPVTVAVPEPVATTGGGVRVRHRLAGEYRVSADRGDGTPIGLLFTASLDDGEDLVEVLPGTATITFTEADGEAEE